MTLALLECQSWIVSLAMLMPRVCNHDELPAESQYLVELNQGLLLVKRLTKMP
jgi:hypothetical protein